MLQERTPDTPKLRPNFKQSMMSKNALSTEDSGSGKDTSATRTRRNGFKLLKTSST